MGNYLYRIGPRCKSNENGGWMTARLKCRVTRKKSPNVYRKLPKNDFAWKMKDIDTFTKNCRKCEQLGQHNCCQRLWKVAQRSINCPIWSHCYTLGTSLFITFLKKMCHSGPLFHYFRLFNTVDSKQLFNKFCRWLDSNRRPLVLEATALPTEPQPLPQIEIFTHFEYIFRLFITFHKHK